MSSSEHPPPNRRRVAEPFVLEPTDEPNGPGQGLRE
jgi:hypothetical protein